MLIRDSCLKEKWKFQCDAAVISVATTPNCSLISVATVGRSIYVLTPEGEDIWNKSGEGVLDYEAWCTAISSDGSVIAVGTANKNPALGTVYIYNLRGERIVAKALNSPVWSLSFSSDGSTLAASCWNGKAYKFEKHNSTYNLVNEYESENLNGLYGIKLNRNGNQGYVCSYNQGIIALNEKWKKKSFYETSKGSYNIALSADEQNLFVGLRQGEILKIGLKENKIGSIKISNCDRPICGISTTDRGEIMACGSFDGWIYLITEDGDILGSVETLGEVWSVACSQDGSKICAGSGDHLVRFFENTCNTSVIRELREFESACNEVNEIDLSLDCLVKLYCRHGLYQYGYNRLAELQKKENHLERIYENKRNELLSKAVNHSVNNQWACYELGLIEQRKGIHEEAIKHFQQAATSPVFTVRAMHHCAQSFQSKNLKTAVTSCYRQARQQQLNNDVKKVLYNLGRSYEDSGNYLGAYKHYQFLASWDIGYRNIWERLKIVQRGAKLGYSAQTDYTGLTTNLLGKDAPRDVDELLSDVLKARTSETLVGPRELENVSKIIADLRTNERFCRGITRKGLNYDYELFLKYDFSLPEDEIKKFLETVNLFYLLGDLDLTGKRTLDIGSATGRYPMLMLSKGAKSFGIDISKAAINYANSQKEEGAEFPKYFEANAADDFPEEISSVNLVTCMMGTFAHIQKNDQPIVFKNIYNILEDGGFAAVSTWDMECSHLSYLSIYDEKQKDAIRRNSPSWKQIRKMMEDSGFKEIEIRPFGLLPEIIIYELGLEDMGILDIELSAQADLVVRSLYPSKHGEMYIAFGKK